MYVWIPMFKIQLTNKLAMYSCDQCNKEFKRYVKDAHDIHLCSRKCVSHASKKGGVIWGKTSKTCLERLGVETPFSSSSVKEKLKQTCIDRYGVENVMQVPSVQAKVKTTCFQRYGVENVLASDLIRSKARKTLFEHYGSDYPQQVSEIREQTKRTNVSRYGVENTLQLEISRERSNLPETHAKRYQTMKLNGTYGKSKVEDELYKVLCDLFGMNNIQRQVIINKWPIDFYVLCVNSYIQLDGVYWHGLDRPIETIAEHKTKRDAQIHRKWITDREQDRWFSEKDLMLVRITDVQFYEIVRFHD